MSEKVIAGATFTVITLQQANHATNRAVRLFCTDGVHLDEMARGAKSCPHCRKVLFCEPTIPKCEHCVYKPNGVARYCPACNPAGTRKTKMTAQMERYITPEGQRIVRLPDTKRKRYSSHRINSADTVLPRIPNQAKADAAEEIAMLSQTFGYDGDRKKSPGFFVGMLRGTNLVQAREKAPHWVMDSVMLREFAGTQSDSKRAETVLYLFHVCGQTDGEIAYQLGGSESAVTKYRQRMEQAGDAFATENLKAA